MSGLSLEEATGDGWINGLHPEDRDIVIKKWNKMVESKGKWGFDYRFQDKQGKVTQIYGLASSQCDEFGNVIRYIGVNIDISDRKKAEDDLRKKIDELQRFHNLTVDRELMMIELKKEINEMLKKSGQKEKYTIGKSKI